MESSADYYGMIEVSVDFDLHDMQEYILGVCEGVLPHQSRYPFELDASVLSPCPMVKFDLEHTEISG